jgi:cysteine-S-conjugate beta-lyase
MTKHPSRWTKLIQPQGAGPVFRSLTDPITRASTVVFDSVEKLRKRDWRDKSQYSYGLQATPTTRRLEEQLAGIDEVAHALLYPSGLSAICMTMMALLKSGDRVLMPQNSYVPALEIARFMAQQCGVEFATYDPQDLSTLTFTRNTRLVWVETPGSITMEVADLPAIAALAHEHGALVAVDATWSAGIALPVFKLGADLSVQALTKYQSGGSDVMMGAVTTADDGIHDKLFQTRTIFGIGVSPEDCYLILRSLPHLNLRYHAQDQSARKIASWLGQHPDIGHVLHPAFEGCPGHDIWRRDFSAAASLFSVVFRADMPQEQIDRSVESLKLFRLGVSWGGAASLVIPFTRSQMHSGYRYQGNLVRFYVGLEDPDDLIADIALAFSTGPGTTHN